VILQVTERTPNGGVRQWWARAEADVYYRTRRAAVLRRGGVPGIVFWTRRLVGTAQRMRNVAEIERDLERVSGLAV
jgi:hypothetical protein